MPRRLSVLNNSIGPAIKRPPTDGEWKPESDVDVKVNNAPEGVDAPLGVYWQTGKVCNY